MSKPFAGTLEGILFPVIAWTAPRRTGINFNSKFHLSLYLPTHKTSHNYMPSQIPTHLFRETKGLQIS